MTINLNLELRAERPATSIKAAEIIQIVMNLPPQDCGVGDYAVSLAKSLREEYSIVTHFVVVGGEFAGARILDGFPVVHVAANVRSLRSAIESLCSDMDASILLHFTPYGYAQRGCPKWLNDCLASLRPRRKVVTFFHEVGDAGSPLSSSFWLRPLQRTVVSNLAKASDVVWTSTEHFVEKLRLGQDMRVHCMPVASNVGELEQIKPLSDRARQLVVFGLPRTRMRLYAEGQHELAELCRSLEIDRIVDVGGPMHTSPETPDCPPMVFRGKLSAAEVHDLFSNSVAGLLMYKRQPLAKSGVFAAFAAHGMLPIVFGGLPGDGLEHGIHFVDVAQGSHPSFDNVEQVAQRAHSWYLRHSLREHAHRLVRTLY